MPSIIGGRVVFDAKGDVTPSKFVIYKITNGKYAPVG
jgi:hypothetical protein